MLVSNLKKETIAQSWNLKKRNLTNTNKVWLKKKKEKKSLVYIRDPVYVDGRREECWKAWKASLPSGPGAGTDDWSGWFSTSLVCSTYLTVYLCPIFIGRTPNLQPIINKSQQKKKKGLQQLWCHFHIRQRPSDIWLVSHASYSLCSLLNGTQPVCVYQGNNHGRKPSSEVQ